MFGKNDEPIVVLKSITIFFSTAKGHLYQVFLTKADNYFREK
ncbi:hypothetical protein HMPREF9148_02244 [Prevotella sp. F0091]|nr:hypothetical protein HMPREF9148_02244 [Prevotella sp. F0091]